MGIRKLESQFIALKPEADWIKRDESVLTNEGGMYHLTPQNFQLSSRKFWCSEIFSIGYQVLEKLEAIGRHLKNPYILYGSHIILQTFDVANFLLQYKPSNQKRPYTKLHKLIDESKSAFFDIVFPLHWIDGMPKGLVRLRETDIALRVMDELIRDTFVQQKAEVTSHGQAGRVAVLLFLRGKFCDGTYDLIRTRMSERPSWGLFIEELKENLDKGTVQISLVRSFFDALRSTYEVNLSTEVDYRSPHLFIGLLEHLLVSMSSCSQDSNGRWFATVSLLRMQSNLKKLLVDSTYPQEADHVQRPYWYSSSFDFIVKVLGELLFDGETTARWIKKSRLDFGKYYPVLVLQLVVLIGVVYLNTGRHFEVVRGLLRSNHVSSILPCEFRKTLEKAAYNTRNSYHYFLVGFAKALKSIGNPLVVMNPGSNDFQFLRQDALILTPETILASDSAHDVLFPEDRNCTREETTSMLQFGHELLIGKSSHDIQKVCTKFWDALEEFNSSVEDSASNSERVKAHPPPPSTSGWNCRRLGCL